MSPQPYASPAIAPAQAASQPLAPAQHKAALWADASLQVDAVISGARIPELAGRLAKADVADFDCLLPGALSAAVQRDAPYLVRLKRDAAFTDWLLFEAPVGLPDWGVLLRSPSRFMPLRGHLRAMAQAQTPSSQSISLAWMDPPLLRALLPLLDPPQLDEFFGPLHSLVIPGVAEWTHAQVQLGQLSWQRIGVAATKAG